MLLADFLHRPVIADRRHLDGLLVLGARDIRERNIGRQMIEPSCLADSVGHVEPDRFCPLVAGRIDRNEIRVLNFRILNLINLRFNDLSLLLQQS